MHLSSVLYSLAFAALVKAHFSLSYPRPWDKLDEDKQKLLCDGYTNATVRTAFPLKGGMVGLYSTHVNFTVGVTLSTTPYPTSFDNFTTSSHLDQLIVPYVNRPDHGVGNFCIPVDIAKFGISGAQNGDNVTIQVIYDGGEGKLYQCATLTLSDSATIPSSETSNCQTLNTSAASANWTTTSSASRIATPFSTTGALPILAITLILSCVAVIAL